MAQTLLSDTASRAKAALSRSQIFDLRELEVDQDGECIVLRGRVGSFYHKQLAQELVRIALNRDGEHGAEVMNAINVVYRRDRRVDDYDW
jgi:hypothetical protein